MLAKEKEKFCSLLRDELDKGVDAEEYKHLLFRKSSLSSCDLIHFGSEWENWKSHLGVFVYRVIQEIRALSDAFPCSFFDDNCDQRRSEDCSVNLHRRLMENNFKRWND